MKFNENLVAVHAYLCADGYVVKNLKKQKHKYFRIGLRNTNLILLKDFQKRFQRVFGIKPNIRKDGRCEKNSKEIYYLLTKKFGSFYSKDWDIPKLDDSLAKIWLRAFFDCEGWVFCKTHQNRHIGLDSINEGGINQIISLLSKIGIKTIKKVNKKRGMYRIFVYGKENLINFKEKIGFLHPEKSKKLDASINDYVEYLWNFPKEKNKCKKFIKKKLKEKVRIKKPYYLRIISREEENLKKLSTLLKKFYNINCLVSRRINGIGTIYYELNINRKGEVEKLIKFKFIPNIFKLNKT
jgi:hypothetical protein